MCCAIIWGWISHILGQAGIWDTGIPPLARNRPVGVLGLGELGAACAGALATLNFQVSGWSRSEKAIDGISCLHGEDGLQQVLAASEIVVLLLPLTAATENVMNAQRFALMPKGSFLLNPGRGALVDDNALLTGAG